MSAGSMKWQPRSEQMLMELHWAAQRAPLGELLALLAAHPVKDFAQAVIRRGANIVDLAVRLGSGVLEHAKSARAANSQGELGSYVKDTGRQAQQALKNRAVDVKAYASTFAASPRQEAIRVGVFALAAIVASGGMDGDGGLPDTDIAMFGIEAHRSPLTHSILTGAACETLINTFIRLVILLHCHLPVQHDPVWDEFAEHSQKLLDAVSRGVSIGVAYHLLVDGLAQPAPYHGLPVQMPIEAHQAIQAANGLMEAVDASTRPSPTERTPALVQAHRLQLREELWVVEELAPWLSVPDHTVLQRQGGWMYALSMGQIAPYTADQVKFVTVAWQLQPASTAEEIAWTRLINLVRIATWKPPITIDGTLKTAKNWFK